MMRQWHVIQISIDHHHKAKGMLNMHPIRGVGLTSEYWMGVDLRHVSMRHECSSSMRARTLVQSPEIQNPSLMMALDLREI